MNEFENNGFQEENIPEEKPLSAEAEEALEETASSSENGEAHGEAAEEGVSEESELLPVEEKKKKGGIISGLYEYVETFCYALALMMVLFLFVFRYVSVEGDSMKHTLHDSDKLIISDLFYKPKTGDIVVINPESHGDRNEPIIKRVIATEGQTVRIDYAKWEIYVDGVKLDEPYIEPMWEEYKKVYGEDVIMRPAESMKHMGEFVVGEDQVFVMGDNRNNSKDSRSREYGEMGENRIIGRVIIRLAPDFGFVK